jgi:hypothetical protein
MNMKRGMNTRAEILTLLEGRSEEGLAKVYQFIQDMDELELIEFLYPSDADFAEELNERAIEARAMLENLRDMEATLRDLDQGKIRIQ